MDIVYSFEMDVQKALIKLCGNLKGKKILVALSGGADSVSLLASLCSLSKMMAFKVFAFHVNHMIRGEEADRDEAFCKRICKILKVKLEVRREDIPALAKERGQSLELCAREYRYEAFEDFCVDNKIDFIATAHNANDNAETVLYNVLRGTGMDGVCGIPFKRGNIIRPILGKSREDILAYLTAIEFDYVTDSTNNENDYTRNFIRNVLLPEAKRINLGAVSAINRLSTAAKEDHEYFETVLDDLLNSSEGPVKLNKLPPALQKRAIRRLYAKRFDGYLESKHIISICGGLEVDAERCFDLPGNACAVTCNGTLSFYDNSLDKIKLNEGVLRNGTNYVAGAYVRVELSYGIFRKDVNLPQKFMFSISLDKDKIKGRLYVRQRKTGDSFVVRNINRNVKKCFINNKVPASARDLVPIICDDEGIVYVPFVGAADRVYSKKCKEACNITVVLSERVGQPR